MTVAVKAVPLRIPVEIHRRVEALAATEHRSTNQQYLWMVETLLVCLDRLEDERDIQEAEEALRRNEFIPLKIAKKRARR